MERGEEVGGVAEYGSVVRLYIWLRRVSQKADESSESRRTIPTRTRKKTDEK